MSQQNVTVNVNVHRYYRHRRPRYQHWWYWLSGVWVLELELWFLAATVLFCWWLLWATVVAIGGEVGKYRALPAWWGPAMDRTRPVWPKRKPAPAAVGAMP